jgi:ribosomal protein S21
MKHLTHEDLLNKALQDPEFKKIWEANAVKRARKSASIGKRIRKKLTQQGLGSRAVRS